MFISTIEPTSRYRIVKSIVIIYLLIIYMYIVLKFERNDVKTKSRVTDRMLGSFGELTLDLVAL